MTDTDSPKVKKTIKKRVSKSAVTVSSASTSSTATEVVSILQAFKDLINNTNQAKESFEKLQREIAETRERWDKEQKEHERTVIEKNQQEEIVRKREEETYRYEIALARKKAENEFTEKKAKWEKELAERKGEIEEEKKELIMLRQQVDGFEIEKDKAIKEACLVLQKDLTDKFETGKNLRIQEFHSEKEILGLKIQNLAAENSRLINEIAVLKKRFDEATRQVKDIAVQVIGTQSVVSKTSLSSNSKE